MIRRPLLWPAAARVAARMVRRGWYRRWPPLPVPGRGYLEFRLQTAYGDPRHPPEPADLVGYLEWSRRQRRPGR